MARRSRSRPPGVQSNNDRWLLTYSDMITLLLVLFIVLFSISSISKAKFKILAHEMAGGFGGPDAGSGTTIRSAVPEKSTKEDTDSLRALAKALQRYVAAGRLTRNVDVHIETRGVVVSLHTDAAMFESGSAVLEPRAGQIIHALAGFLLTPAQRQRAVTVEGNTDDVPISTPLYPTNWELSASRAVAVTRHLSEFDALAPDRLSATGLAEWHPRVPNNSAANRLLNRRVDIVVLRYKER